MAYWEEYVRPQRIEEALAALEAARGLGRVIAGGTDLLLDIQQGRQPPAPLLVDVAGIPELTEISLDGDVVTIGAAVTHAAIVDHPVLQARASALVQACGLIGGPQVRRVATLGGNVAHALPAGDGTIALLALDAQAELASTDGRRRLPLLDLFSGPGETTFDRSREILTSLRFDLSRDREGSAFVRVMRPQGVAIAILNAACWLRLSSHGSIEAARLAVGPTGPVPRRALESEKALVGKHAQEIDWTSLESALLKEAAFRTSPHRATKEYRRLLAEVVLRRAVTEAAERAAMQEAAS